MKKPRSADSGRGGGSSKRTDQRFDRDRRQINQLMEMFPGVDEEVVRMVLENAGGNETLAINELLALTDDSPGEIVERINEYVSPQMLEVCTIVSNDTL
jgi:hypothetical protein